MFFKAISYVAGCVQTKALFKHIILNQGDNLFQKEICELRYVIGQFQSIIT